MGTMHGVKSPRLSESAVNRLIDPRTGERLRPLGVLKSGKVVYPMMGASPDDASSSESQGAGGNDNPDDEHDKDPEGTQGSSTDSSDDARKTGDAQAKIDDLTEEKDRHVRRRQEAERERDELRKQLEERDAKDTPELEQLQKKVAEADTTIKTLSSALQDSRLEVAFLRDNTYSWHNPGRALKLADLSGVEIDDDGTVHGLKPALERLAKSDPYLIKESDGTTSEKKDPPSTDTKTKSKKDDVKDSKDKRDADLRKKYPSLSR